MPLSQYLIFLTTLYMNANNNNTPKDNEDDTSKSLLRTVFLRRAQKLVAKPLTLIKLVNNAIAYFKKYDTLREVTQDIRTQFERINRLVLAYAKGEYRGVALGNIALSVAVLLYLVSPIDLIPDFLVGGLLDDLALLTWLYRTFSDEMERFLEWEDAQKTVINIQASVPSTTTNDTTSTNEDTNLD